MVWDGGMVWRYWYCSGWFVVMCVLVSLVCKYIVIYGLIFGMFLTILYLFVVFVYYT